MLKKFLDSLNNYAQSLIAITTIVGLLLVLIQLSKFSEQNENLFLQSELLRKSLIQSYRPLGYIMQINKEHPNRKTITGGVKGRKDKFSFGYEQFLINKGAGVLINIGHLYYLSTEKMNFRENFLNHQIDSSEIKYDARYEYTRRESLLPGDTSVVFVGYDNLEFEDEYYLYILQFYEDQEGNLYDTENKINMKFNAPTITNDRLNPVLASLFTSNYYGSYSESQKKDLIQLIKSSNHPMWKFISQLE